MVFLWIVRAGTGSAPVAGGRAVDRGGSPPGGSAAHAAGRRSLSRHLVRQASAVAGGLPVVGRADRRGLARGGRGVRVSVLRAGVRAGGDMVVETGGLLGGGAGRVLSDIRHAFGGAAAGGGFAAAGAASGRGTVDGAEAVLLGRGGGGSWVPDQHEGHVRAGRVRRVRVAGYRSAGGRFCSAEYRRVGISGGDRIAWAVYRSGVALGRGVCRESGGRESGARGDRAHGELARVSCGVGDRGVCVVARGRRAEARRQARKPGPTEDLLPGLFWV